MVNDKSYWLSAGIYTFLQRIFEFLFGFFGFYFLVRIVSKDDFGIWVLYITVISVVDTTRNGFIQNGLIKYLVNTNKESSLPIQSASLLLNICITVFCLIILIIITPWLSHIWNIPHLSNLLVMFYISLIFFIPLTQVAVILQARMNFKKLFWIQTIRVGLFFSFIFYLWLSKSHCSLTVLAEVQTIIVAISAAIAWILSKSYVSISLKINKDWISKLFHFGKYVLGTNLMSMLGNSLDKFVLGALLNPAQVAVNNVAGRILNFIEVPVNTVATIVYPKSAESMEQSPEKAKESVRKLFEQSVGITLGITIPFFIFMMILAKPVIILIAGTEYLDAVPFLRVILVVALLRPYDRQSGITLDAMGKPHLNFLVVLLNLIIVLISSFVFIKFFGLMGAAYAVLLALIISVIIKQIMLAKFINSNFLRPLKYTLLAYQKIADKIKNIRR